jgi:hypothetical protein
MRLPCCGFLIHHQIADILHKTVSVEQKFEFAGPAAVDLLSAFLRYDPLERFTAMDALVWHSAPLPGRMTLTGASLPLEVSQSGRRVCAQSNRHGLRGA